MASERLIQYPSISRHAILRELSQKRTGTYPSFCFLQNHHYRMPSPRHEGANKASPLCPPCFLSIREQLSTKVSNFCHINVGGEGTVSPRPPGLAQHLYGHARIRLNSSRVGFGTQHPSPPTRPRHQCVRWELGNPDLPHNPQRFVAFGAPVGTQELERQYLQDTFTPHTEVLQTIPTLDAL